MVKKSAALQLLDEINSDPINVPIDKGLEIENIEKLTEEKRLEVAKDLKHRVEETLKKLKGKDRKELNDFVFAEKILLLEQTKKALDAFLMQILSSPSMSTKAVEVLSLIIKANADLIKDIAADDSNTATETKAAELTTNNSTIYIAPSEAMLDTIIKQRHPKAEKK